MFGLIKKLDIPPKHDELRLPGICRPLCDCTPATAATLSAIDVPDCDGGRSVLFFIMRDDKQLDARGFTIEYQKLNPDVRPIWMRKPDVLKLIKFLEEHVK